MDIYITILLCMGTYIQPVLNNCLVDVSIPTNWPTLTAYRFIFMKLHIYELKMSSTDRITMSQLGVVSPFDFGVKRLKVSVKKRTLIYFSLWGLAGKLS